ncbi:hypothetical protein FAI41_04705 [Acetobacteraceae bacterium]|nr:hypothetical protein FAI41_04705 [Acetobacteraceae bacterium]
MYRKTVLVSVLFFPLLLVTSVKADSPYYSSGQLMDNKGVTGSVSSSGQILDTQGVVGSISPSGQILDTQGVVGSISPSGQILDTQGVVGSISPSGQILDTQGVIGSISPSGQVMVQGAVIGSVPPGNGFLAFQMIQRYNRQKQQQARYNQQYYQQRNAAIAAQNDGVCREAYQLCQKPYEEVVSCENFNNACASFRKQIIEDYAEHASELHRKDCDAKLMACSNANNALSCRPYWSYCADYDQERRKDRHWQGVKLPALSTQLENNTNLDALYQPCTVKGHIVLLHGSEVLSGGTVSDSGVLLFGDDAHKVGTIDEAGHITIDKHISHKDKYLIKQTTMLGQVLKDGNFLRCGTHQPPRRLGFVDHASGKMLQDNIGSKPPGMTPLH